MMWRPCERSLRAHLITVKLIDGEARGFVRPRDPPPLSLTRFPPHFATVSRDYFSLLLIIILS